MDSQFNHRQWIPSFVPLTAALELTLHRFLFEQDIWKNQLGLIRQTFHTMWYDLSCLQQELLLVRDQTFQLMDIILNTSSSYLQSYLPLPHWTHPTLAQFMAQGDPNMGYCITSWNINGTFKLMYVFHELLNRVLRCLVEYSIFPQYLKDAFYPELIHTMFIPFHQMAQASWNIFNEDNHGQGSQYQLRVLSSRLQNIYRQTLNLQLWGKVFSEWLTSSLLMKSVFLGNDPYSNSNVKKTAHMGSMFFDTVTAMAAIMFEIGDQQRQQNEAAANAAFTMMYDHIVNSCQLDADTTYWQSALNRHWNNKGNSMETLMLLAFEQGRHDIVWLSIYICINITYAGTAHRSITAV
jgi:hypothetical protein